MKKILTLIISIFFFVRPKNLMSAIHFFCSHKCVFVGGKILRSFESHPQLARAALLASLARRLVAQA